MSGPLHPAEWNTRIGSHHLINEDHARFELIDEVFFFALIVRPCARSEPKPAVIGDSNRFIHILHPENRS